jgi:hypothetical protein
LMIHEFQSSTLSSLLMKCVRSDSNARRDRQDVEAIDQYAGSLCLLAAGKITALVVNEYTAPCLANHQRFLPTWI